MEIVEPAEMTAHPRPARRTPWGTFATWVFVLASGWFYSTWAQHTPYNQAPDEHMRYAIVRFIVRTGTLPLGTDPEIRDPIWGTSYAFQPILSYIVGAGFAKVAALRGADGFAELVAARHASVLFGTATVAVCFVLGRRLFTGPWRWVFAVGVAALPQFGFLSSYVNNDSLALFASALVVLSWVKGLQDGWTIRTCMLFGASLAVCALSYYNAYGFILLSVVLFCLDRLRAYRIADDKAESLSFTLRRGGLIAGISALLAGWWFIRNAVNYNGDFLGLATSDASGTQYGQPYAKPGASSGRAKGMTLLSMLFYEGWLWATIKSATGWFGYLSLDIPKPSQWVHRALNAIAGLGNLAALARCWPGNPFKGALRVTNESPVLPGLVGASRRLLQWCFVWAIIIPWMLSIYFSWTQDYQPQGRYILPMLIPFTYFMTRGIAWVVERFLVSHRHRQIAAVALCAILIGIDLDALAIVITTYG
ncbi:MAG: glycosyltransferase family 39 protein [Propionibacteriaceae bacterium]|nr:glycosyltransferase family 39 protein [Micropruina sp.]HBX79759.1 hypothetical protein [Propionibacteriaceae bacterium]HBY24594.1 hypothetical protein [Propionibacteriaceae bacterium]